MRKAIIGERNKIAISEQPGLAELEPKLLPLGGEIVVLRNEPDLENILKRGEARSGDKAKMMKRKMSQSHENVAGLYDKHRGLMLPMTGYALSDDGIWRQHSWLLELSSQRVVETTVRRKLYYGFLMTEDEAELFLLREFLPYREAELSHYALAYAARFDLRCTCAECPSA